MSWRIGIVLLLILSLVSLPAACGDHDSVLPVDPFDAPTTLIETASQSLTLNSSKPDRSDPLLSPEAVRYFDIVDEAFSLTNAETSLLAQNGFVVSDAHAWERFLDAYAWIYWKDLPVFISTDSILHAVHQSYDDLLQDLEEYILAPRLAKVLLRTQEQLKADRLANDNIALEPIYADVALYLDVAISLLLGIDEAGDNPKVQEYIDLALAADTYKSSLLFGSTHKTDFTLFKPRGHYAPPYPDYIHYPPADYFRAMSWLAHIDFRFVEYDPLTSEPLVHPRAIAAAMILRDAMEQAGQRDYWDEINAMLMVLVGRSDNMTFTELDQFLLDTGLDTPDKALHSDAGKLLQQLEQGDYGQQRITGQIVYRHVQNDSVDAIPRPISFMLMGQRFVIDSYVLGNLVYDRLQIDGQPVPRPLPTSLDLAYALGNDRASDHLKSELEKYGYQQQLEMMRELVDELDSTYWETPIYNQWLRMIRALNSDPGVRQYPASMKTTAWTDKLLQTQLASWTQLRHDHILYAKQSFSTAQVACEYPDAYVEPYPEFYAALGDYAQAGYDMLLQIDATGLPEAAQSARSSGIAYFESVTVVAGRLQTLAEKELRGEDFSAEDMAFIQNAVVRHLIELGAGCGGPRFREEWDGWYRDLFYRMDDSPALIADVHTNPTHDPLSELYPPRVLHVATGPVSLILFVADRGDDGPTLFAGPAFSYFEVIETGDDRTPPQRLNDQQWLERLQASPYPEPPNWTASFRVPANKPPAMLPLPEESIEP